MEPYSFKNFTVGKMSAIFLISVIAFFQIEGRHWRTSGQVERDII